jgi:hypothetical protein
MALEEQVVLVAVAVVAHQAIEQVALGLQTKVLAVVLVGQIVTEAAVAVVVELVKLDKIVLPL